MLVNTYLSDLQLNLALAPGLRYKRVAFQPSGPGQSRLTIWWCNIVSCIGNVWHSSFRDNSEVGEAVLDIGSISCVNTSTL